MKFPLNFLFVTSYFLIGFLKLFNCMTILKYQNSTEHFKTKTKKCRMNPCFYSVTSISGCNKYFHQHAFICRVLTCAFSVTSGSQILNCEANGNKEVICLFIEKIFVSTRQVVHLTPLFHSWYFTPIKAWCCLRSSGRKS